jgi:hypothetical protein
MFTRQVVMQISPHSAADFARIMENEVSPVLRGQRGLYHEETFISPETSEAIGNSYWATEADADAYNCSGYKAGLRALSDVIQGTPTVESFVISSSTFHRITTRRREVHRRDSR